MSRTHSGPRATATPTAAMCNNTSGTSGRFGAYGAEVASASVVRGRPYFTVRFSGSREQIIRILPAERVKVKGVGVGASGAGTAESGTSTDRAKGTARRIAKMTPARTG